VNFKLIKFNDILKLFVVILKYHFQYHVLQSCFTQKYKFENAGTEKSDSFVKHVNGPLGVCGFESVMMPFRFASLAN